MEAGRSRRAAAGLIVAMSVARTPCDAQPALPDLVPVGEPPLSLRVDPALSPWRAPATAVSTAGLHPVAATRAAVAPRTANWDCQPARRLSPRLPPPAGRLFPDCAKAGGRGLYLFLYRGRLGRGNSCGPAVSRRAASSSGMTRNGR